MAKEKIAFLINSLAGGGAERVVSTLLNNYCEQFDCYLIVFNKVIDYQLDGRITVISLHTHHYYDAINFLKLPILGYKLARIIHRYQFKTMVSFLHRANYVNVLSRYFSKHQVIISERIAPSSLYGDNSLASKISRSLIRTLYPKADLVIPVSKAIKQDLINNFGIRNPQVVIYNPYDIKRIQTLAQEPITMDLTDTIVCVGSLSKRKDHVTLIQAFAKVRYFRSKLLIMGEGTEKEALINLVATLGLSHRVIFGGFDNNPYKYIAKASMFVLASTSEGFPNVIAEALICGCPVISTDCLSGPREILNPSTDLTEPVKNNVVQAEFGVLVPVKGEQQLADAIDLFFTNSSLIQQYKEKSQTRIIDFSITNITQEYLSHIFKSSD